MSYFINLCGSGGGGGGPALTWLPPVSTYSDLPTPATAGDVALTLDTGDLYYYNGTTWVLTNEGGAADPIYALLTGFTVSSGSVTSSDSILSAIEKLSGDLTINYDNSIHIDGSNTPIDTINWNNQGLTNVGGETLSGNVTFNTDNAYNIGNTTSNRASNISSHTLTVGVGSGESGTIQIGDQSKNCQINSNGTTFTLYVNGTNALTYDGTGNVGFNTGTVSNPTPFFSFGTDGNAVLGGYPSPAVHTFFRPGNMAVKYAIGIGTNAGETGTLQLGDYTKGNNFVGRNDGSFTLNLNNQRRLFIDSSATWWLDQDNPGGNPSINFVQDGERDIGQSSISLRPRNIWMAGTLGIGLAATQVGTIQLGASASTVVGDALGNITLTPTSGAVKISTGPIQVVTAGYGLSIAHGTNCKLGSSTLSAGSVVVSNTSVTSNSLIFLSRSTSGGTLGDLSYTISAGTSFTITSSSGTDTSTVAWLIVEGL
jgi:hypothetical protein